MNLFISWSGKRSEHVAQALRLWIKCVLQSVHPFFSPRDISGGSIWLNKLNEKLAVSNAGIICLTHENQHEPWIQFESGALAKGLPENRVFVLLIGMESHEVTGPLSSFNHTLSSKEGIKKLILNINESLGDNKLEDEILNKVFEKNIEDFMSSLNEAINQPRPSKAKKRDSSDIQIEMLDLLRGISNRVSKLETRTQEETFYNPISNTTELGNYFENFSNLQKLELFKKLGLKIGDNNKNVSKLTDLMKGNVEINKDGSSDGGGI